MNQFEKMAVVIDADNTQLTKIGCVLDLLATRGRIVTRRAYGNWKKDTVKNWEPELQRLAIKPCHQPDYVAGKNATDMALTIDTMDLLYRGIYDAFVIVASDSDYTPLAVRLRESGAHVLGVGRKDTSEAFRSACDEFLFLEDIGPVEQPPQPEPVAVPVKVAAPKAKPSKGPDMETLHRVLQEAYEKNKDSTGFADAAKAGVHIHKMIPDFDCKKYGFKKFSTMMESFPERYQVERRPDDAQNGVLYYRCLPVKKTRMVQPKAKTVSGK